MIIATHSGKFHADDVWAVMVLDLLFPDSEVVRTRDPETIRRADFAVDVGGIWDARRGRFDHHQKDFAGARQSGVAYASAGLVWREHGARAVATLALALSGHTLAPEQARQIAHAIDFDLVQYLDLADNGAARSAPGGYGLSAVVSGFNPTWIDEERAAGTESAEAVRLRQFRRAMEMMADILANAVRYRVGALLALEQVRAGELLEEGRVLRLENGALPWNSVVRSEMPQVLFVISFDRSERRYMLHTVPAAAEGFAARKDLPASWSGLQGEQLAAASGVADAVFCHKNLFIAAAHSYEGALALARLALLA